MLSLGFISFATPWALAAAAALPLVWLLLRLTPPSVRQINFPAIRLLFDLDPTKRTAAHTPPWLLLLRIGILLLALLGLADPILNARQGEENGGPIVVVLDNGWASATAWDERAAAARGLLETAERRKQTALLITTAPTALLPGAELPALQMQSARDVLAQVQVAAPQSWPTNRLQTAERVRALKVAGGTTVTWISDGVDGPGTKELGDALARLGPVTIIENHALVAPLVQYPPERNFAAGVKGGAAAGSTNAIGLKLARPATPESPAIAHTVRAVDSEGQVLSRTLVSIAGGQSVGTATMSMPSELANRIARFDVEGVASAATTVLADDQWQRRPVGIAGAAASGISAPLLEDAHYLQEALAPFADARAGTLEDLLSRPLAVLFMAGGGRILDAELARVSAWVDNGGLLVRFAGPRLDGNVDTLLPVKLRSGGRSFGGTMSWNQPMALAPFPETSPFRGMVVPEDVTVTSQVLAEPSADLAAKTWARLSDGTPLVTAERRERGWVVLVHVTATPEWSKLPLSGLFVDMLRRMIDVSQGVPADGSAEMAGALEPRSILDGRGRLNPPGPTVSPVSGADFLTTSVSPTSPPGLYGPPGATRALNLSAQLPEPQAITAFPANATRMNFDGLTRERNFKPWLLTLALVLLLADLVLSFMLRRLIPATLPFNAPSSGTAAMIAVIAGLAAFTPFTAKAGDAPTMLSREIDLATRAAILETRLAYVATGNAEVDRVVNSGLGALTALLFDRTAAELKSPTRIDLASPTLTSDMLTGYPIIYWRVTASQGVPAARALTAINDYLQRGGMVIFDAPDQAGALGGGGPGVRERLNAILDRLDIPQVEELSDEHVLNRSFYLMHGLPGRYAGAPVLVQRAATANDGVSSVVIGSSDWAAAWAKSASGGPQFAVIPGGETQRELAFRAGVNMVMYALTGNYKADQVHAPAILQRLTQ